MVHNSIMDLEWLNAFIAVLTPILVSLIGAWQWKRDKNTKREKELQAKLDEKHVEEQAKEKQAIINSLEMLTKRIDTVGQTVQQIGTQVNTIADDQTIQKTQLEKLSRISEVNLEYSRSLGNVVITMGNSLRATDMPEAEAVKVDKAIMDFRENEQKLLSKLYKAMY